MVCNLIFKAVCKMKLAKQINTLNFLQKRTCLRLNNSLINKTPQNLNLEHAHIVQNSSTSCFVLVIFLPTHAEIRAFSHTI